MDLGGRLSCRGRGGGMTQTAAGRDVRRPGRRGVARLCVLRYKAAYRFRNRARTPAGRLDRPPRAPDAITDGGFDRPPDEGQQGQGRTGEDRQRLSFVCRGFRGISSQSCTTQRALVVFTLGRGGEYLNKTFFVIISRLAPSPGHSFPPAVRGATCPSGGYQGEARGEGVEVPGSRLKVWDTAA